MNVAVVMPSGITDEWRERARVYVERWYAEQLPGATIHVGGCASAEWSKGEAIADAVARAGSGAQVLVLADADSFMLDPKDLRKAVELVNGAGGLGGLPWVTPHRKVYRLRDTETARLQADPKATPRLGHTARPVYEGPIGGGITVVHRHAFEAVGGIDRRFLGWGGEDVAFGWALEAMTPGGRRLEGALVHLWHPHPAPTLRGSPESEALVAQYRAARGVYRRMAAVVKGEQWEPAPELAEPIRFTMTANRSLLRLPSGELVRFRNREYSTRDPDVVEQLRTFAVLREDRRR